MIHLNVSCSPGKKLGLAIVSVAAIGVTSNMSNSSK